ncbi:hypothetical protein [Paraburkholderia flava]|uniref:hypothetical protein n=1 Tax=Paraburkholderia flava TaxID=2547393 RepID=UPI001F0EB4C1|nr:hypothetical protein [Paraburkholderia flava]
MKIPGGPDRSSVSIFRTVLFGSLALEGQPVRCVGIAPGIGVRISAGSFRAVTDDEVLHAANGIWQAVRPKLVEWLTSPVDPAGLRIVLRPDIEIEFGRDGQYLLRPGVAQIDIEYDPAFVAWFDATRAQRPLIETQPKRSPERTAQLDRICRLIETAIRKTVQGDDPLYERLPAPVRYRASGAIEAWDHVRQAAGEWGTDFLRRLRTHPVLRLMDIFPEFIDLWTEQMPFGIADDEAERHAGRSIVWQTFSAREGALYEPTPALHRLLDAAWIADDVPVGAIRLPTDTMCIVPDPSWWGRRDGIESVALFYHPESDNGHSQAVISCATWTHRREPERRVKLDVLQIPMGNPDRTIKEIFDEAGQSPDSAFPSDPEAAAQVQKHWSGVLDYVVKMLLYLTVREAHVVHDRAYSDAPRNFSGLGKRKRAERLAQIEQLYDRHIVGPAILDAQMAAPSHPDDEAHREVRGHWRRPHFRMQPYGPNGSLRKLAFIGPTLVRPDRLGL